MSQEVTKETYRKGLGLFATGVTVITVGDESAFHGMTANALCSVSMDPPLVLLSLDKQSDTQKFVEKTGAFGINILRHDQEELAKRFAKKTDPIKDRSDLYSVSCGVPLLADALCSIACRVWTTYDGVDHYLYLGKVEFMKVEHGSPLLFFNSRYAQIV